MEKLRLNCITSRRLWTRAKRKSNIVNIIRTRDEYREERKKLSLAIFRAKEETWKALINDIDRDPWELAYIIVTNKLRQGTRAMTKILDSKTLEELIIGLFPRDKESRERILPIEWNEDWNITPHEVYRTLKKRKFKNTAPGPDGITIKAWKLIPEEMIELVAKVLTKYLKEGCFPVLWKTARLVLISKESVDSCAIPKARPICLLDEIGKVYEKIILQRVTDWMQDREESGFYILSENQFGFRKWRSTVDALIKVTSLIGNEISVGRIVFAVSIDIKNAFNSLPWDQIKNTLLRKRFPRYMRRMIHSYLSDRNVTYTTSNGNIGRTKVLMGVPQGFVFGPYLWNVTYDQILKVEKMVDSDVIVDSE